MVWIPNLEQAPQLAGNHRNFGSVVQIQKYMNKPGIFNEDQDLNTWPLTPLTTALSLDHELGVY